jgi:predicted methyltransferase
MTEHQHVCPWWIGYLLASPIRRLFQKPEQLLAPFLRPGMTVLEPGPGMGFFTIPMTRMVGESGCIHVRDVQKEMLDGLERRARKAGVWNRIRPRLVAPDSMDVAGLKGKVDVVCAFAMVHELPSAEHFFAEAVSTMKPAGILILAEPSGHVSQSQFESELDVAGKAGLQVTSCPVVRRSHCAVLRRHAGEAT